MVKINFAVLALATLGPALSFASPTGLEDRDVLQRSELVERQGRRIECARGGSKRARAKTVASCIDSIADYGKNGRQCSAGATRKLCAAFSSLNIGINTGGPDYYVQVPCINWARDLGAFLDQCTNLDGTVKGHVVVGNYQINVQSS